MSPGLFVLAKTDAARAVKEQLVGARLADSQHLDQSPARRSAVFAWIRRLRLGRAKRAMSERLSVEPVPRPLEFPAD